MSTAVSCHMSFARSSPMKFPVEVKISKAKFFSTSFPAVDGPPPTRDMGYGTR